VTGGSLGANDRPLRVGIHSAIPVSGVWGGVEQHVIGLVEGLGKLQDGDEKYYLLTHPSNPNWLEPYRGANQVVLPYPSSRGSNVGVRALARVAGSQYGLRVRNKLTTWLIGGKGAHIVRGPADSDGYLESLNLDLIHFPYQHMIKTRLQSVYSPWDLLHLHYPCFFAPLDVAAREVYYPVACRSATRVVVASAWIKRDLVKKYCLDPKLVHVLPSAPSVGAYATPSAEDIKTFLEKYRLPKQFAYYPAATYPHKNHLRLFEAVAQLRDENGVRIDLVCTGTKTDFWPRLSEKIEHLFLTDQVHFLGFVEPGVVRALYRSASFIILPTLFEGGGLPMVEAFFEGVPVASSTATHLPEQAGDAALFFDPESVDAIADALLTMSRDQVLLGRLAEAGRDRSRFYDWARIARQYRAVFRDVCGVRLGQEDQELVDLSLADR
jgi:glycosyltransferase involved in cell wall biosynthesis